MTRGLGVPLADDLPSEALAVLAGATEHRTVHAGATTMWHRWGPGHGEPVVLLHGGSGSWTHWIHTVQPLAASGRAVWAADLPGCGDSDKPAGCEDADGLPEPLAAGIAELVGPRAWDLVGFSFGGLAAGLLAAMQPAHLRRLVLVGAPAMPLAARPVRLLEWRHLPDPAAREAVHRANLGALMLHRPESITPLAVALHAAHLARDRLRRRRLAQTDALQRALHQVRVPMAAIYGQEDALFTGRQDLLEGSLRATPGMGAVTFIPGAGHWVQFEAPQAFLQALLEALPS